MYELYSIVLKLLLVLHYMSMNSILPPALKIAGENKKLKQKEKSITTIYLCSYDSINNNILTTNGHHVRPSYFIVNSFNRVIMAQSATSH